MLNIDYNTYRSIVSFNRRVHFLVMHYTAGDFATSIKTLTGNSVSAHYLVPNPNDESYIKLGFKQLQVFNLVDEKERAWHAGVSDWGSRSNLNDSSLGIEIVNQATEVNGHFIFPRYHPEQIEKIILLSQNILQRYPDILPTNIVGHSDIAIGRKSDPGAAFPWHRLYRHGVGAWYDNRTRNKYFIQYRKNGLPSKEKILILFNKYGYDISSANTTEGMKRLIRAFQLHFRARDFSGLMDNETMAILAALVEKYFNFTL